MTFKINLSLIFCRLTVETGGNGIVFEEKKTNFFRISHKISTPNEYRALFYKFKQPCKVST